MAVAPPGYVSIAVGRANAVCVSRCERAVREALGTGTLHQWAGARADRRALHGRGVAWAVTLPDGVTRVVVRHSRHGGALARVTGDRFLAPTRAPHELATSVALRTAGVRTPEVVATVVYMAGPFLPLLRRADVATRLVPNARDLAEVIAEDGGRAAWVPAVVDLLRALADAGARHADLNLKNILIAPEGAWALDVDVVALGTPPAEAARRNAARLARSLEKWRGRRGLPVSDDALQAIRAA